MKLYNLPILNKDISIVAVPGVPYYEALNKKTENITEIEFLYEGDLSLRNDFIVQRRREYLTPGRETKKLFYLITPNCNGRCSYCYANHTRDNIDESKYLSYEGFKAACDKHNINIDGCSDIQVLGGEPLLYVDDLIMLAKNHPNVIIGISTSLILSDDIMEKVTGVLAKLPNISFSISIDPPCENYPRIYNGEPFYKEALSRLARIDKATNKWGIRTTISNSEQDIFKLESDIQECTGDNKSMFAFTADLLMGEAASLQTSSLDSLVSWAKQRIDTLLLDNREELSDINFFEERLPYPVKHFFALFNNFGLRVVQQGGCCDVVSERLAIDFNGEINYCAESPMTKYADDWRFNGVDEALINKRVYAPDECKECEIFQYCGGVCFFNYYYYGLNEQQCEWWKKSASLALYAYFNYHAKYKNLEELFK